MQIEIWKQKSEKEVRNLKIKIYRKREEAL